MFSMYPNLSHLIMLLPIPLKSSIGDLCMSAWATCAAGESVVKHALALVPDIEDAANKKAGEVTLSDDVRAMLQDGITILQRATEKFKTMPELFGVAQVINRLHCVPLLHSRLHCRRTATYLARLHCVPLPRSRT